MPFDTRANESQLRMSSMTRLLAVCSTVSHQTSGDAAPRTKKPSADGSRVNSACRKLSPDRGRGPLAILGAG